MLEMNSSVVRALDQASYELQGTKPLHYYHAGLLYMCIGVCVSTEDFGHIFGGAGWRRCIGCLKLQTSFRKRATNYRALLQKKTYKDKVSDDSTPPCNL